MADQRSLFRYSILYMYIGICFVSKVFGCTSTTTQYKRPGDDVTIQFQATTVNSEDASLVVVNQIMDYNDTPLVSVVYKNGVNTYITTCTGCTFTGNVASGDLSIKLDNIQSGQAGTYKHSVIDTTKAIKGCVKVYVLGGPTKPSITVNKIPFEGESVTLTCSSTSTTTPRDPNLRMMYTWKDGNKIASDTRFTYSDTKNKVTISNVARNDVNKQFTCTAKEDISNAITSSSSDTKKIDVYYKPENGPMIQGFNNNTLFYAILNKPQTLTCTVIGGYPLPSLSWSCFPGSSQDLSSGQNITQTWTWTVSSNGTCKCTSTQNGSTDIAVLYVRILSPPTTPTFKLHSQTVQPSSTVKILRDSPAPITCSATSFPSPDYKWTYNGQTTEVSDEAALNPSQVTKDGHYYCNVQNTMKPSLGRQETGRNSAFIDIQRLFPPTKPELRYHNQSGEHLTGIFNVVKGDNFNMYCSSTGNPTPNYLWTGDGRNIHDKVIVVSTITQDRSYRCKVTNTMNPTFLSSVTRSSSSTVSVSVLAPATSPTIRYHSQSASTSVSSSLKVIKGKSFGVSCSSTGIPTPTLSWSGPTASSTNTLVLTSVQNDGTYTCTASNYLNRTFGKKETVNNTSSLHIQVLYAPVVKPFNIEAIVEGSTLSVECKADPGNPPETTYSWKRKLNSSTMTSWQDIPDSSIKGGHLDKQNINKHDAGTYKCTALNIMKPTAEIQLTGSSFQTFLLNVLYPAAITLFDIGGHEGNSVVILNENDEDIRFICKVDSNPVSTVKILLEGEVKNEASDINILSFVFNSVSCLDSGEYTCEARNGVGPSSRKRIQLFVNCSPRPLYRISQNISSLLSEKVTLSFTVLAYPKPGAKGFVWYKRNGANWTQVLANRDLRINSTALQSHLTILNTTKSDYGQYKLIVKNDYGTYIQNFNLTEIMVEKGLSGSDVTCDKTETNRNTLTVGIVLGILIAILTGCLVAMILLYRRKSDRKEAESDDQKQREYMNVSNNTKGTVNQQQISGRTAERVNNATDEDMKQYMDLSEYSRENKSTYDHLNKLYL